VLGWFDSYLPEMRGLPLGTSNPGLQPVSETDGRGVTVLRTVDALDRVTFVAMPDPTLHVTYLYDDPAVSFSLGQPTAITRGGTGRTTPDLLGGPGRRGEQLATRRGTLATCGIPDKHP